MSSAVEPTVTWAVGCLKEAQSASLPWWGTQVTLSPCMAGTVAAFSGPLGQVAALSTGPQSQVALPQLLMM